MTIAKSDSVTRKLLFSVIEARKLLSKNDFEGGGKGTVNGAIIIYLRSKNIPVFFEKKDFCTGKSPINGGIKRFLKGFWCLVGV